MRARGMMAALALGAALAGCRDGRAAAVRPLPGSAPSLAALGEGIVSGFVAGDTARLRGYRLSLAEYRDVLWPRLGVDPKMGPSFDFSWHDTQFRGERASRRYLERMKDLPLRAQETRCDGPPDQYEGMKVLRDCKVVLVDDKGTTEEMQLFRSVVVIAGGYKIIRYDD